MAGPLFAETFEQTSVNEVTQAQKPISHKLCCVFMTGANYTMSSPSWVYYRGSPVATLSTPRNRSQKTSPGSQLSAISSVDFIENERSLTQYLQDFDSFERTAAVGNCVLLDVSLLLNVLFSCFAQYDMSYSISVEEWCLLGCYAMWLL
jgi:hypothetical protein